jgi:hypothetical protein
LNIKEEIKSLRIQAQLIKRMANIMKEELTQIEKGVDNEEDITYHNDVTGG